MFRVDGKLWKGKYIMKQGGQLLLQGEASSTYRDR